MRDKMIFLFSVIFTAMLVVRIYSGFEVSKNSAVDVKENWGYQNTVTTVYLKDRMYDTIFEVLIFSLVVAGVASHHKNLSYSTSDIEEDIVKRISNFFGFLVVVFSLYMAITGHKYPGGGFTAGVAGGTALMLMGFSRGFENFEAEFEKYKVDVAEKTLVAVIVAVSMLEFWLKADRLIIIQNVLIYFKVMAGTWIMTYNLMKHRGIV